MSRDQSDTRRRTKPRTRGVKMAQDSAAKKRKAKSVKKIAELLESGKAKQTVRDLSNKSLSGIVENAQGKSSPRRKQVAAAAADETARRGGGTRATARSRRARRKKT